ncbi:MAG TPA: IgGFc-binding protein [Vicinamibacteria bacterium]|nr:IgGFc-binding protein [Vicinamibacteria bacterium]
MDNKGSDFIMAFLPNLDHDAQIELHITADVATTVTVTYPVNFPTFIESVPVNPGSVTMVALPQEASSSWTADAAANNAVRAFADDEFVAYMINRRDFSSDAALGLPVDVLNTEYIVLDYNRGFFDAEFIVVAAYDGTTVTITPAIDLVGRPAGVPFDVFLDRGEGYFGRTESTSRTTSLTGTIVTADRPVGVTNGNVCSEVPTSTSFCDHLFEVAHPVRTWGREAAVANLPNRPNGSVYRVVASVDETHIVLDGASLGTIHRGQFVEIGPIPGDHLFAADKPIFVGQYMTGSGFRLPGDPSMGNVIPSAQFLPQYTFSTVGADQFLRNYVSIIAHDSDVGSLLLDGVAIPASDFSPIGSSGFSATVQPLDSGTHSTSSSAPHGITVEGYDEKDSYLYAGGAQFEWINPIGDENSPLCTVEYDGDPPRARATAQDDRPSEDGNGNGILDVGEDLNANGFIDVDTGVFSVSLVPGATNLTLTTAPFAPGDPVVLFAVDLTDPSVDGSGRVEVTDGAGNQCSSDIFLSVSSNQPPVAVCQNMTVFADASCESYANVDGGSYDPDGDPISLVQSPPGPYGVGLTSVTLTAYDGNASHSCSADVTVIDDTPPEFEVVASPSILWPPNHKMHEVSLIVNGFDNCTASPALACWIDRVSSNEDPNGPGDGNTPVDWMYEPGSLHLSLRAERSGQGAARVYTIGVTCQDEAGTTSSRMTQVVVPHDQGKGKPASLRSAPRIRVQEPQ